MNYRLGEIDYTAPQIDPETGASIPGKPVIVLTAMPPGLPTDKPLTRAQIKKAVIKAVYEDGLKEFGNRKLVVVTFDEPFEVPFEEITRTELVPPGN